MAVKLDTLQRYAEKVAQKLGVTDTVTVRWHLGKADKDKLTGNDAHIHVRDTEYPRGTICIGRKAFDGRGWRWTIAHEVTHLKVKNHHSPYFNRYMARLGFNQMGERTSAVKAGLIRHRHDWRRGEFISERLEGKELVIRYKAVCRICGKER